MQPLKKLYIIQIADTLLDSVNALQQMYKPFAFFHWRILFVVASLVLCVGFICPLQSHCPDLHASLLNSIKFAPCTTYGIYCGFKRPWPVYQTVPVLDSLTPNTSGHYSLFFSGISTGMPQYSNQYLLKPKSVSLNTEVNTSPYPTGGFWVMTGYVASSLGLWQKR